MELMNQARCRRCGASMETVAEIAPFGNEPGLVAFLCSDCGTTDSVLVDAGRDRRLTTERRPDSAPQYQL
jgi:uncharacterized Zn finger protein